MIRVIDFEATTGEDGGRVIEVGWCDLDPATGAIGADGGYLCGIDEETPLPPDARAVHHIRRHQLAGLPRTGLEAQHSTAAGVSVGQVSAEYQKDDKHLRVEIIDMGGMSALAQMAGMVQGEKETNGRVEKIWQEGGRTRQEEYHKDGSSAEAKSILKNGLVVSAQGSNMPIDEVRGALAKVDLGALEGLARKKP